MTKKYRYTPATFEIHTKLTAANVLAVLHDSDTEDGTRVLIDLTVERGGDTFTITLNQAELFDLDRLVHVLMNQRDQTAVEE